MSGKSPSWLSYAAMSTAFHALANTETGSLHAAWLTFSFVWAVPALVGLVKWLRDE